MINVWYMLLLFHKIFSVRIKDIKNVEFFLIYHAKLKREYERKAEKRSYWAEILKQKNIVILEINFMLDPLQTCDNLSIYLSILVYSCLS